MLEEIALDFLLFSVPALIYGILMVMPFLLFVLYQRFSHRYVPKLNFSVWIVTGIGSFVVALLFTTRSIISFNYAIEIPYGYGLEVPRNEAEKKVFDTNVINEAIYRSLVPTYFQKPCDRTPELVCQLGINHAIDLREYRIPFTNGIISAIVDILIGLWAQAWVRTRLDKDHHKIST